MFSECLANRSNAGIYRNENLYTSVQCLPLCLQQRVHDEPQEHYAVVQYNTKFVLLSNASNCISVFPFSTVLSSQPACSALIILSPAFTLPFNTYTDRKSTRLNS